MMRELSGRLSAAGPLHPPQLASKPRDLREPGTDPTRRHLQDSNPNGALRLAREHPALSRRIPAERIQDTQEPRRKKQRVYRAVEQRPVRTPPSCSRDPEARLAPSRTIRTPFDIDHGLSGWKVAASPTPVSGRIAVPCPIRRMAHQPELLPDGPGVSACPDD